MRSKVGAILGIGLVFLAGCGQAQEDAAGPGAGPVASDPAPTGATRTTATTSQPQAQVQDPSSTDPGKKIPQASVPSHLTKKDWTANPLGAGIELPSVAAAATNPAIALGFTPRLPRGDSLGRVFATRRGDTPAGEQRFAALLKDGHGHQYAFVEAQAGELIFEQSLRRWAAECVTCDYAKEIVLENGRAAVVLASGPETSVYWLGEGLLFQVSGPHDEFTPEDAIAAANRV